MDPSKEMEIAVRAFELWEIAGSPHGRDLDFWFIAEREIRSENQGKKPAWDDVPTKLADTPEPEE